KAAEFIIREYNRIGATHRARIHYFDNASKLPIPGADGGVGRMLVQISGRLVKCDRRQLAGPDIDIEITGVAEMPASLRASARRRGIEASKKSKRLMVPFETNLIVQAPILF